MLNETASSRDGRSNNARFLPIPATFEDSPQDHIRELVGGVLDIESETFVEGDGAIPNRELFTLNPQGHLVATFEGRLLLGSEAAYEQLDTQLKS